MAIGDLFSAQRLGLLVAIAAAAAAIVGVGLWARTPDYRVLYANVSDRDGGAVLAALQQMNITYKVADGGGAILVPAAQVHDTRLRLAGQGLPRGGHVGFELLESARLGTSQFIEQVNYQRGLEGELARSIQTLSAVQSARVHLALSRPSAFLREAPKASASVVLALHPGRSIEPAQVNAIVHLVSSSVPELPVRRIAVLDQGGNLLSADAEPGTAGLDASQLRYVRELEAGYAKRIESILTPLVGPGNVRAQVSADVDFSHVERAEEIFKPNQAQAAATLRSQQTSESSTPAGAAASGVPGALSNQPPAPAAAPIVAPAAAAPAAKDARAAPPAAVPVQTRRDATVNYEVDRTIQHVRQPVGSVKRVSAAVVVNYRKPAGAAKQAPRPLAEDELAHFTALAREAIGFSQARGDSINVVNRLFSEPEILPTPELPLWKDPQVLEAAKDAGRYLLFALVALYLFFAVIRPMFRRLTAPRAAPEAPPAALPPGARPALPGVGARSYEQNLESARSVAQQEPRLVANVVKGWVGSNE